MTMKYFIVKQNCDYADEFDVNGFALFEAESREALLAQLIPEGVEFPAEQYFGTNEAITFDDKNDYIRSLKIQEITNEEYKIVTKVVGSSYGHFFGLEED